MRALRYITQFSLPFIAGMTLAHAAAAPVVDAKNSAVLQEKFKPLGVQVLDAQPSEIKGLLEVNTTGGIIYTTQNGEYFIAGTLYHLDDKGSVTDVLAKKQAPINAKKIDALADDMIVYKAPNEKYVITVFTDISCGYCVKLHNDLPKLNELGITVRYLAFPRQGAAGEVADKMAAIWCDKNPADALHNAKTNKAIPAQNANFAQCQKKIQDQYHLGRELGVSGTPAIFTSKGEMIAGYLPAPQLLERLKALTAK